MNNIIRFWNQNRKSIIIGVVAIVFLLIIIQVLDEMARIEKEKGQNVIILTEEEKKLPTQSIIGGESVSIETTKSNVEIVEEFIEKCNNKDVEGAYSMLTDECKEVLYKTKENFKKGYLDVIFKNNRIVNIENFISNNNRYTYRVDLYEDILSTGNAQSKDSYIDYITIDEKSKNGKLNINSFIYKQDINKYSEKDGIKITILSREVYKEDEKYQIKIENTTEKTILIDTKTKSRSVYLVGGNNITYDSNISEMSSILTEVQAKSDRDYEIKFYKIYSTGVRSRGIAFLDIVSDSEKYKQMPNEVKERVQISISM